MNRTIQKAAFFLIIAITAFVSFFPVVWIFLTSVKVDREIYAFPVVYVPTKLTIKNYINVFTQNTFGLFFFNSGDSLEDFLPPLHSGTASSC